MFSRPLTVLFKMPQIIPSPASSDIMRYYIQRNGVLISEINKDVCAKEEDV